MIDLKKLEKINNEILDNDESKKSLINDFKNLLDHLAQIEYQFEKTYELAKNLDSAINLIHQIARKSNKEFTNKNLVRSIEKIKCFIELRKDLINKALNKLESKEPLHSLIQTNYKTLMLYLDNELSILKIDTIKHNELVLREVYSIVGSYNTTDIDGITYLFFDNYYFTQYIEYVEKKLGDAEFISEIVNEYPTFHEDLKNTLNLLYEGLNESMMLVKNYTTISTSVYNTCKKYYNV